jgi:hypothetical protein
MNGILRAGAVLAAAAGLLVGAPADRAAGAVPVEPPALHLEPAGPPGADVRVSVTGPDRTAVRAAGAACPAVLTWTRTDPPDSSGPLTTTVTPQEPPKGVVFAGASTVPGTARPGGYRVAIGCADNPQEGISTTFVVPTPDLGLEPRSAHPGDPVVATGRSFPVACAPAEVQVGGAPVPASEVPGTTAVPGQVVVRFLVPRDAGPGPHRVVLGCGAQSAAAGLDVTAVPVVTSTTVPASTTPVTTTVPPSTTPVTTTVPPGTTPVITPATAPAPTTPPGPLPTAAPPTPTPLVVPGPLPTNSPAPEPRTTAPSPTRPSPTPTAVVAVPTPPLKAAGLARTAFARSLSRPDRVDWSPPAVLTSLGIAVALFVAIGFPAEPFNKTLEENRDRLPRWLRREEPEQPRRTGWWHFAGYTALGAALLCLIEDGAWFNGHTATLAIALLVAVPLTTIAYSGTAELYLRGPGPRSGQFRVVAIGLLLATACVAVSRLAGLQPGYAYGLFGFFATGAALARERRALQGPSVLWASVTLLVLGVMCWLLWPEVAAAAEAPSAPGGVLVLDSVLATVFVLALQGVVFGLLPIAFMDGRKLRRWKPWGWLLVWGPALFLFVHVLVPVFARRLTAAQVVAAVAPFLLFGLLSAGLWLYLELTAPDADRDPAEG